MFRKNTKHQQPALISAASELPEKQRKRLENSWAGTFYKEFFSRIDEQSFAVLYSEKDSRPNVPVNVLVGLEALTLAHALQVQVRQASAGVIKNCMSIIATICKCAMRWAMIDWAMAILKFARCTTFENG
jgi:hypothetical protein